MTTHSVHNPTRARRTARAMTLIELTLALLITAMMGLSIASMMTVVGSATQADRDGRAVLLRAHAGQARFGAYMSQSRCVLQNAPERGALVIWLHDVSGQNQVNLTEFRVFWHDSASGVITVERVEFPDDWSAEQKEQADVPVAANADFLTVIEAQRALNYTVTNAMLDGAWSAQWTLDAQVAQQALRATLAINIGSSPDNTQQVLFAFGVAEHNAPAL